MAVSVLHIQKSAANGKTKSEVFHSAWYKRRKDITDVEVNREIFLVVAESQRPCEALSAAKLNASANRHLANRTKFSADTENRNPSVSEIIVEALHIVDRERGGKFPFII